MYSNEHKNYLKKKRKNRLLVLLSQLGILLLFLIIWEVLADTGVINKFISSSPKQIVNTIVNLHTTNSLYNHIWVTIYETLISFVLGTLIGIIIASLLWCNKFLARVIDPYLTILNSLPKVALGPVIIIWCGAGIKSIILMALFISVIITIINVYQGFISIDNDKIKLMKALHASKKQIYFKLLLPGSFNNIISTLKINISMSLIGVTMGELLVSKEGIGYLIMYGSQVFNLNLVMSGVIILCAVSALMYYLICLLEKKITKK